MLKLVAALVLATALTGCAEMDEQTNIPAQAPPVSSGPVA